MLSRTADHLFWMARYMERAENTARMLDVNYQASLMPQSEDEAEASWKGLLSINELSGDYAKRYPEVDSESAMRYMVSDAENGSSIRNCLQAARENARAVRGNLTTDLWEIQNQTWLEFQRMIADEAFLKDPSALFEWVKFRSHLSRGVTVGTMLKDESFCFLRIGSFLERADNTARLLDVKFHAVESDFYGPAPSARTPSQLSSQSQSQSQSEAQTQIESPPLPPSDAARDTEVDFYHWSGILRSVSGFEIYRKVYRNVIRPEKVAELLILRADMPRSLLACVNEVVLNLGIVANEQSTDTLREAGRLQADLRYGRIDEILDTGLHAYLTQFLERVAAVGVGISRDFLVPVAA